MTIKEKHFHYFLIGNQKLNCPNDNPYNNQMTMGNFKKHEKPWVINHVLKEFSFQKFKQVYKQGPHNLKLIKCLALFLVFSFLFFFKQKPKDKKQKKDVFTFVLSVFKIIMILISLTNF